MRVALIAPLIKQLTLQKLSDIPRQFDNFLDQFYQIKGAILYPPQYINALIGDLICSSFINN